eukprot:TRINITY_DN9240_c0_g1_i1.p1 TRINITY_DN9240_c0_g1~~TRINITY_DN9240_c0_g1_i1.p1  ORF type:complete len:164 (+),score=23.05 TRINITY_DN9240_c0_g1_i1:61-492(+)
MARVIHGEFYQSLESRVSSRADLRGGVPTLTRCSNASRLLTYGEATGPSTQQVLAAARAAEESGLAGGAFLSTLRRFAPPWDRDVELNAVQGMTVLAMEVLSLPSLDANVRGERCYSVSAASVLTLMSSIGRKSEDPDLRMAL